ncbi:prenyltransferase/squalene oxidase repeat-containing protein [Nocardioides pacificus]
MKNSPRRPAGRRLSALLAAGALATSAIGTATMLPSQAAPVADPGPGYDEAPAQAGAGWLVGQLTDGLIHSRQYEGFVDYGLSIDTALALDAVGGHDATVQEITDAVAGAIDSYTTGADYDTTDVYAGATAKAAVLAQVAGRDDAVLGGVDLIERLETRTADAAPIAGRIEDGVDPTNEYGADYANVIGQGFAARALALAGSDEAAAATSYLLAQQCGEGYFRLYFTDSKTATEQSCDAGPADKSTPDTDVTAMTVLALDAMPATPEITAARDEAVAWLRLEQGDDGSFGGGTATEAPNVNSTGLAGWALGVAGETDAAESAASWVRRHQAEDLAPCVTGLTGQGGALAYDAAALRQGIDKGIGDATADQWQRATAQALPSLLWSRPDVDQAPQVAARNGYVRGGSAVRLSVTALPPARALCVSDSRTHVAASASQDGTAQVSVTPTERTGTQRWTITTATGSTQVSLAVLGDKALRPSVRRASVARGKKQVVRVRGLAAGEKVTVRVRGTKVAAGRATGAGAFVARFVVRGKPGPAKVRVRGQFADRAGTVRFEVA